MCGEKGVGCCCGKVEISVEGEAGEGDVWRIWCWMLREVEMSVAGEAGEGDVWREGCWMLREGDDECLVGGGGR